MWWQACLLLYIFVQCSVDSFHFKIFSFADVELRVVNNPPLNHKQTNKTHKTKNPKPHQPQTNKIHKKPTPKKTQTKNKEHTHKKPRIGTNFSSNILNGHQKRFGNLWQTFLNESRQIKLSFPLSVLNSTVIMWFVYTERFSHSHSPLPPLFLLFFGCCHHNKPYCVCGSWLTYILERNSCMSPLLLRGHVCITL